MKRLIVLALLLVAPASASAAPLNELPFTAMPDRSAAGCLEATGVKGEIALLGPYTRQRSAIDLLTVSGSGVEPRERLELGRLLECPAIAADRGGAAIAAGTALEGRFDVEARAALREPGGAFAAPLALGRSASPAVAVDPSGGAVVAWATVARRTGRIRLARRAPGAGFGPAVTISRFDVGEFPSIELAAGMDAAGNATLLWARELPSEGPGVSGSARVEVATVPPSGAPAIQRLARTSSYDVRPRLAVARGGGAFVVFEANRKGVPIVFERPAGGSFARVALSGAPEGRPYRTTPVVALGEDGGAVVAWRAGTFDSTSGIEAVTRAAGGSFGPVTTVAPPPPLRYYGDGDGWLAINPFDPRSGPPIGDEPELEVALSDDGRVLVGWRSTAGSLPLQTAVAHAATGRLGGTFDSPQTLGAPMRRTTDLAALFLADGRAALAWTDNARFTRDGRLHVAVESAAPQPAAPAPRLTVEAPRRQRLYASQGVRLTARCDAACDLRAAVRDRNGISNATTATLLKAGTIRLRPFHERAGRARIVVQATAPGGDGAVERTLRIRIARRPSPPFQAPLDVRARRDGDAIVVKWRTAGPAKRQSFVVVGVRKRRDLDTVVTGAFVGVEARGRRRHSVRLHARRLDRVRWVGVLGSSNDGEGERFRFVRVR